MLIDILFNKSLAGELIYLSFFEMKKRDKYHENPIETTIKIKPDKIINIYNLFFFNIF